MRIFEELSRRLFPPPRVALPPRSPTVAGAGRGYIEDLEEQEGGLLCKGWLFHPTRRTERVGLYLDGALLAEAAPVGRPDVGRAFPAFRSAGTAGFRFQQPPALVSAQLGPAPRLRRVEIVAFDAREALARLSIVHGPEVRAGLPEPPEALRARVTGTGASAPYWTGALQSFGEFHAAFERHRPAGVGRLLDWGCGCGRTTALFLRHLPGAEIHGCDIDAEAVAWCAASLPGGAFQPSGLAPPLPYGDGAFDAITAYSIFTHLPRDLQRDWLAELRRVLAPGGHLFATVHGEHAARFVARAGLAEDLAQGGVSDRTHDQTLDGVAPAGYYRAVFQRKSYTLEHWSKELEVVEYVEGGCGSFQDLVVLRRRG